MSSQLKLDWVKNEGGQYVETNRIDPFGDSILRISFADNYDVESEVSTAMIDAIENQNSTGVFALCTKGRGGIILGTGASNCNTDSSFDDWSSYDEDNDGCLKFSTPSAFNLRLTMRPPLAEYVATFGSLLPPFIVLIVGDLPSGL